MSVYLLHFQRPFGHAEHYLGWADRDRLQFRLGHHGGSEGANLLRHVAGAGIGWDLTRIWPDGDRTRERRIKNNGTNAKVCPVCNRGHRFVWPDGAWLQPAPTVGRPRICRCGTPATHVRPWGRGTAGLCLGHAARYAARHSGATDAEIAAGTRRPAALVTAASTTGSAAA